MKSASLPKVSHHAHGVDRQGYKSLAFSPNFGIAKNHPSFKIFYRVNWPPLDCVIAQFPFYPTWLPFFPQVLIPKSLYNKYLVH